MAPPRAGVLEGANDADTLYCGFIMNLMLRWTNTELLLMFRDDVISLAGPHPFRGAWQDRRKRRRFPGQKYPLLQPGTCRAFFLRLLRECMSMLHENA